MLFTTCAYSQDFVFDKEKGRAVPSYIGQLKLIKGSAFKKSGENTKDVETGERFKKNDILVTNDKSFAKILLIDDTILSVGPESELKFDDIDFKDKSDRRMSFTLVKGQLTGNVKNKAANPGDIKFRTKYATMGVRGTYILMNAKAKNNLDIAEFALLSGKADVLDFKNQKFELNKGDRIVIIREASKDETKHEAKVLTEAEFNILNAPGIDEEKDFKPFLPHFDLKEAEKFFSAKAVDQKTEEVADNKREEEKPNWEENLQKLNQKLKENQKKH